MIIISKKFKPHYNVAMDKVITSQRQYDNEMKRGGYVPYEQAKERVAHNLEKQREFKISGEAIDWIKSVKDSADKDGNVKLSDRQIDKLKECGTITNRENPALKEAMGAANEIH